MPMRQECKHYESRTYGNNETVRKCNLDLAPDAPWRCPDKCPSFERRMDMGWTYGTVVPSPTPAEPPGLVDGTAAAVLDAAEDHLNAVGAQIMAEVRAEQSRGGRGGGGRWRIFRRRTR